MSKQFDFTGLTIDGAAALVRAQKSVVDRRDAREAAILFYWNDAKFDYKRFIAACEPN